jgi:hypothetical protein
MYLFSRAVTLRGSPRQVAPWVQKVTTHVNANSPLDVTAWNADFGHPIGTVVWNAVVESQQALADGVSGLLADDPYHAVLEEAADMVVAPGEDALRSMVHGSPSETSVGSVAMVTTGVSVLERTGDVLSWSVDIAQYAEKVGGTPVSVWTNTFGNMTEMTFISVFDSLAALEAGNQTLQGDAGWMDRLHASGGLWEVGSGLVARFTRML